MARGAAYLRRRGFPEPLLEAEVLLRHLLGLSRAAFLAEPQAAVPRPKAAAFLRQVRARARGVPSAYLVGEREFFGLSFRVTPAVLIPRPETEGLVQAALELLPGDRSLRILEVGTGSGCVAVALAVNRPELTVVATDVSLPALAVARENVRRHGVAARVHLLATDVAAALRREVRFHGLLANPPYVAPEEAATLPPDVREHEPAVALFSPAGGMAFHERLLTLARERLLAGGILCLEVAPHQARQVAAQAQVTLGPTEVQRDLAGRPRIVVARREPV